MILYMRSSKHLETSRSKISSQRNQQNRKVRREDQEDGGKEGGKKRGRDLDYELLSTLGIGAESEKKV